MKTCISILAVFIALAISGWGQEKTGSIKVQIYDSHGAVVPNAKASLLQDGKAIATAIGDSDGRYEFKNVRSGDYLIEVKWFFQRPFHKRVSLKNSDPDYTEVIIAMDPCSDDPDIGKAAPITREDRIEIVRQLFDLSFEKDAYWFVPYNIDLDWLSASHKTKLKIRTRAELQEITEKNGSLLYYHAGKLIQRGGCVVASMLENHTVKGELEDANMSGGETIYEFRRGNGRWVGEIFGKSIS